MVVALKSVKPLVLILGSPRSGTTWLAKLFDSSEQVLYRHEPDSIVYEPALPFVPALQDVEELAPYARRYLNTLVGIRQLKASGSLPTFPKSYRSSFADVLRQGLVTLLKVCDGAQRKIGLKIQFCVPDMIRPEKMSDVVIVMKSVNSLTRAKVFARADEDLKIVHIIRHPCAFVASELRGEKLKLMVVATFLEAQAKMSEAQKRGLSLDVLQALSLEEQLASLWMLQNEKVMEEMEGSPNYKMVIYEKLCERPQETVEELFEYSGLHVTGQTREFIGYSQSDGGGDEKYFQVIRDSKKAAQKWRDELSPEQVDKIMNLVGDSKPGKFFSTRI